MTHPELSRRFLVLKPAILPARMASDLFESKQILCFWLLFLAITKLMSRVSKIERAPIGLVEWLVFLLACAAEVYATALSVTAALGALKAVGWKPQWVLLGLVGAMVWILPTASILLANGAIPTASRFGHLVLWIASASCLGYMLLLILLWAETEALTRA